MLAQEKITKAAEILAQFSKFPTAAFEGENNVFYIKEQTKSAYNLLLEFQRANLPKPKSKIDLLAFTSTATYKRGAYTRPVFTGVYHAQDEDVAIACDTHIIILSKSDFDPEKRGQVITKKGEVLTEGKEFSAYPKFRMILPKEGKLNKKGEYMPVDLAALKEKLADCAAQRKMDKKSLIIVRIPGTECYLKYEYAKVFAGLNGTLYHKDNRTMVYYKDDNYEIGIMPIMKQEGHICVE